MTGLGAMILGALGVLAALLAAWFSGKTKGTAAARVEAAEQRSKDNEELAVESVRRNQAAVDIQNTSVNESNEIDEDVKRMSDDDLFSELRSGPAKGNSSDGDKK